MSVPASETSAALSPLADMELSLVIPTYREKENFGELFERLDRVASAFRAFEVWVVDDNSPDGSEAVLQEASERYPWLHFLIRREERGLSTAVLAGFERAQFSTLAVMDADLSHPPEKLLEMGELLLDRAQEMVFGSRFVKGGAIEEGWSAFRFLNSFVATTLARPFTRLKDPMSGFFMLKRDVYARSKAVLNPVGYKIGLELIVKSRTRRVSEVPIFFSDRKRGESKLSLKEQLNYLRHLRRLANFKFGSLSYFMQFGLVGASGSVVQLAVVTLFDWVNVSFAIANAIAIAIAMSSNFIFNNFITFNDMQNPRPFWHRYFGFVGACSIGALVNYGVGLWLIQEFVICERYPQLAVLGGILSGMGINFLLNRYWVFRNQSA